MRLPAKRRGQAQRNSKQYLDVLIVHIHSQTYPVGELYFF